MKNIDIDYAVADLQDSIETPGYSERLRCLADILDRNPSKNKKFVLQNLLYICKSMVCDE